MNSVVQYKVALGESRLHSFGGRGKKEGMKETSQFFGNNLKRSGNLLERINYPVNAENPEESKLSWLIQLRWLAIGLFVILIFPAWIYQHLHESNIFYYIVLVFLLGILNFFSSKSLKQDSFVVRPIMVCFHLTLDLVVLFFLLLLTGGFSNPFVMLFLLNAALGGILISDRLSLPFLLLTHGFLVALQFEYFSRNTIVNISAYHIFNAFIYHLLIFSLWFVMRSLGRSLEKQYKVQMAARVFTEKQDRLRAVGSLAAGFSHEFASPLNAAKLRISRAIRKAPEDENLQEAMISIENCEQIIRQMNSSQLDSRDHQLKLANIKELTKDIAESWLDMNPEAKLELSLQDLGKITVPPVNYAQIILNLLDNAYEEEPNQKIILELKKIENTVYLSVKDLGRGFPQMVMDKMGEPFITTKSHGTGLGLYVSQLFV